MNALTNNNISNGPRRFFNVLSHPCLNISYSMKQRSSSEANSWPARQQIPSVLWNPKIHYRVRKRGLLGPNLGHMSPLYAHVLFPSTLSSPLRFPDWNSVCIWISDVCFYFFDITYHIWCHCAQVNRNLIRIWNRHSPYEMGKNWVWHAALLGCY